MPLKQNQPLSTFRRSDIIYGDYNVLYAKCALTCVYARTGKLEKTHLSALEGFPKRHIQGRWKELV